MHIYARKRMYIHKHKRIYDCWSLTTTLYYSALYRLSVPIFLSQDGDDARVNDVSILLLSVYLLLQPLLFILLTSPHLCSSSYIFSSHPFWVHKVVAAAQKEMKNIAPNIPFLHVHHVQSDGENGYFKLSNHFKWALDQVSVCVLIRHDYHLFQILTSTYEQCIQHTYTHTYIHTHGHT